LRFQASSLGACHDRRLFTRTGPQLFPAPFFEGDQHAIGDRGFIGPIRVLVCPFRINPEKADVHQEEWNTDVRNSRICNERGIGDVKNRFRVFLGGCSYRSELLAPSFELCAMLCNWRLTQSGDRVVPLHRQLANMDDYNATRLLFSSTTVYLQVTPGRSRYQR